MTEPYPTVDYGRSSNRASVLIIGAGISGMTTAIEMIRKGYGRDFIIVEKGNQVGGTWSDNRYPGCCCDIWSHLYSLSFEPNPNWTRLYPGQEEIYDYLVNVAQKYQLYKHIRFSSSVEEARWDAPTKTWQTKVSRLGSKDAEFGSEYTITSDFLVSGVGQLNIPKNPDIQGLSDFKGKVIHSARWDWDYDIRNKRIGIIGNGATAAQIIPEIAKVAKSLTVFQRTPNWVIERQDTAISKPMQAVFNYVPFARRRVRAMMMDFREGFFDAIWSTESPVHDTLTKGCLEHMEKQLPGEKYKKLRELLTPKYAVGCKRVIISDDYFLALARENVFLETSPIHKITEKGIEVDGGEEHEFDLLVLATGFKTTQFMYPIQVYGTEGKSIEDIWSSGASAYLGMTVPELPNFSMLYGPNTNLGHNSIILMIEAQAMYITELIAAVQRAKLLNGGTGISLSPKPSVAKAFNDEIQARLNKSAFADPNCNSWYKNEAGLITNNWSDTVVSYQKRTSALDLNEYDIEGRGAEALKREKKSWPRVVEETQVSNAAILTGLAATAAAVTAGALYRRSTRGMVEV